MYPGNKRKKLWREEKERLLKMTLEERRKEYLGDYVALKTIPTWMEDLKSKSESDGIQEQEETSVEPMKIDLASQAADVSNKDAEMNSQVESINDPMETEQKA